MRSRLRAWAREIRNGELLAQDQAASRHTYQGAAIKMSRNPSGPRPNWTTRSTMQRFAEKVLLPEPRTGCWMWTGAKTTAGYGTFSPRGKSVYAHRYSYEQFVGPIPRGLELDHLCRNPACVNPDHLEAVTQRTNVLRSRSFSAQNAVKTHCSKGHEFSPDNTWTSKRNQRNCITCHRRRSQEARRRSVRDLLPRTYGLETQPPDAPPICPHCTSMSLHPLPSGKVLCDGCGRCWAESELK